MAFLQVSFSSSTLGCCTSMNVILPQKKTNGLIGVEVKETERTYPVLYLLHGMSDDHTTWCRRTSIERYAEEAGIAVVMPTTGLGWYTNMKHGLRWRTFIGEELPQICRDFFPRISNKREDTFIAGLSMGGYGAYALALTYPEQYSAAAGLSGAYDYYTPERAAKIFWSDIFGPLDEYRGGENDLFAMSEKRVAEGVDLPRLFMWCGTEDGIYNQSIAMRDHLRNLGWHDFHYEESHGGHGWACWDDKIQNVLDWLGVRKRK